MRGLNDAGVSTIGGSVGGMNFSFVIPLYNERDTLEILAQGIAAHVGDYPYQILFVDDGSTDGSHEVLATLSAGDPRIGYIRFRRNLGKTAALAAGFAHVQGDYVFTMDADLQDDAAEIPRFIEKLNEGHDVVTGWKKVRHDAWHKVLASRIYNSFVRWLFGLELHDVNSGFKLMRREVVERLELRGDLHRLIPVLAANLGYRVTEIPVQHHPRRFGRSKYGFERFTRGALDTLSVWFLHRHRHTPGHFFAPLGLVMAAAGLICSVVGIGVFALWEHAVGAVVLLMVGAFALHWGVTALGLGLLAELLVRDVARLNINLHIAERILPKAVPIDPPDRPEA